MVESDRVEEQPEDDDAGVIVEAVPADARPLRVGERVRSTIVTPVFPSDPKLGDTGKVIQASSSSYLVRWDAGSEGWATRSNLEPLRMGDSIGAGAPSGDPPGGAPSATRPRRTGGQRAVQRLAPILFLLLVARGLLPELGHVVRHPTPTSVVIAIAGIAAVVALVLRARRRVAAAAASPDADTTGTTDGK
jgi:hypothetical protein